MKYDVENITEQDMAWDEYSVMEGMTVYTVRIEENEQPMVYYDDGSAVAGEKRYEIIASVNAYKKGEKK